jgi:hypothetical protein
MCFLILALARVVNEWKLDQVIFPRSCFIFKKNLIITSKCCEPWQIIKFYQYHVQYYSLKSHWAYLSIKQINPMQTWFKTHTNQIQFVLDGKDGTKLRMLSLYLTRNPEENLSTILIVHFWCAIPQRAAHQASICVSTLDQHLPFC